MAYVLVIALGLVGVAAALLPDLVERFECRDTECRLCRRGLLL